MTHSISVVIASYNGIKYIPEQLDSIKEQTLPPDEVIIADDCSSDGTYEFCVDYIARHNLKGWRVYRNEHNTGLQKNFRAVLAEAGGEYIFTCDQDDIWMPDKISAMVSVLRKRPEISLLASNYIPLVDGKPAKVYLNYIERDDGSVIPFRLQNYGLGNLRPGCTFCFRRRLLDKFKVMDVDSLLHDSMLWKYAITSDSLYLLNRRLIFWRRHENAATGVEFSSYPDVKTRIQGTYAAEEVYGKFVAASEGLGIPAANVKYMEQAMDFQRRRREMLAKRSLLRTAIFVALNMKYYPTLRNALSDIYAMIFLK